MDHTNCLQVAIKSIHSFIHSGHANENSDAGDNENENLVLKIDILK